MKAVLSTKARGSAGLVVSEMPTPKPRAGEILVAVHASSVTAADVKLRTMPRWLLRVLGALFGFKLMKVPGVEFAGVVTECGSGVTTFLVGDAVMGTTTGLAYGANAQFVCLPARPKHGVIVHKPTALAWEHAAVLPIASMTASDLWKRAGKLAGARVLVYGASGSVGNAAVHLARLAGAEVWAVCSEANREVVASWGCAGVRSYQDPDWQAGLGQFAVVFDAVGKLSKAQVTGILTPGGRYLSTRVPTNESASVLAEAAAQVAAGLWSPHISHHYTLDEVATAHDLVGSGRKVGNVVVVVGYSAP